MINVHHRQLVAVHLRADGFSAATAVVGDNRLALAHLELGNIAQWHLLATWAQYSE